ncbi:unnamed protein product [Protopolystoma xenopodis]|uniref:Uncharacterized protein n=1 Tax=Protopolystoma xenopodis TaxID=117903 RepID=A0A3S4ZY30_9PLAT|nr:unnamed protein product [Protopolystoma xenopodis]
MQENNFANQCRSKRAPISLSLSRQRSNILSSISQIDRHLKQILRVRQPPKPLVATLADLAKSVDILSPEDRIRSLVTVPGNKTAQEIIMRLLKGEIIAADDDEILLRRFFLGSEGLKSAQFWIKQFAEAHNVLTEADWINISINKASINVL